MAGLNDFKEPLLSMKANGFSNREIRNWLEDHGIVVTKRSIERAFQRWRREEGYVPPENKILDEAESYLKDDEETALKRELISVQAELRRARSIIRQYNDRSSLEDRIAGDIRRAMENNPYAPMLSKKPRSKKEASPSEHEMLLLVSDAHYPEVVNPDEALGIEYGPETVRLRLEHLVDRTLRLKEIHENSYPIGKITVAVLGDMLSGNIHEELEITNAMPMGDALTNMAYMLHDMGSEFADEFDEVEMIIMPGNHPRLTKKPRNKQKWDNFEYIMGQFVAALAQGKYDVAIPKDIVYTHEVFDMKIGMTHGDGSKAASFAGIPFYGLKNRANANQAMRSVLGLDRLDMLVMGHFHQLLTWTEGDCHIFINGAIKGGDEYSIVTRSSATEPVQALLTFHEKHGWISTERIPLGDIV